MRRSTILMSACLAMLGATASPASQKPCRSPDGRIVACPKPEKASPPRCKDDKGRFVPCPKPGSTSRH